MAYKISVYIDANTVSAQQFVDLQQGDEVHAGFRRAHAKGICVSGVFESNGALSNLSSADVLSKGTYPIIGRFSISGNNPIAPDLDAPVRSFAFSVSAPSSNENTTEWRIAMNTPPVMAVATPEAFYEQLKALAPAPETNKRDPSKIQAFFAEHPESQAFLDWRASYSPSASFASEQYHSINAFYLIDSKNAEKAVRWRVQPSASMRSLPEVNPGSDEALMIQLKEAIAQQAIKFDWIFMLANPEDDETNPTIPWPEDRRLVNAGTLVIDSIQDQETGQCGNQNFDPLVLPKGVKPTADPILNARAAAYAESFRRRARETLLDVE